MSSAQNDDLSIEMISSALTGKRIDLVVSGSIGAIESPRLIRSLRRLGAEVHPWLTDGGAQFVTPVALAWAANHPTRTSFSGHESHIAMADACVVAPATMDFISKIASGSGSCPSSTLVQSYLGCGKPVLILPNMHNSLAASPAHQSNLKKLSQWATVLGARMDEGKHKFPTPAALADQICHALNRPTRPSEPALIVMGSTRGYFDSVRYVSNISSGKMGTMIAESLFREGFDVRIVSGPVNFLPEGIPPEKTAAVETNEEMENAAVSLVAKGVCGAVFVAAILDYAPEKRAAGKLRSGSDSLSIELRPMPKIIQRIMLPGKPKIGFKLEPSMDLENAKKIAASYGSKYDLSLLIANGIDTMGHRSHGGIAFDLVDGELQSIETLAERSDIASKIVTHFSTWGMTNGNSISRRS